MSENYKDRPIIGKSDLGRAWPKRVQQIILHIVNDLGVKYRLTESDGGLLLYPTDGESRPVKFSPTRPEHKNITFFTQFINDWCVEQQQQWLDAKNQKREEAMASVGLPEQPIVGGEHTMTADEAADEAFTGASEPETPHEAAEDNAEEPEPPSVEESPTPDPEGPGDGIWRVVPDARTGTLGRYEVRVTEDGVTEYRCRRCRVVHTKRAGITSHLKAHPRDAKTQIIDLLQELTTSDSIVDLQHERDEAVARAEKAEGALAEVTKRAEEAEARLALMREAWEGLGS